MYSNRIRRRRHRSNPRPFHRRNNGRVHRNSNISTFANDHIKTNPFKGTQSAHKLIEKYDLLAKEALSSGDKILSENYFQHADHFSRIVADVNTSNKDNNPTQGENQTKIITPNVNNNEVSQVEEKQKKEEIKK